MTRFARGILLTLIFLGVVAVLGHWVGQQARFARGIVRADPHTYVSFAEQLAEGRYVVDHPLAKLAADHLPPSSEALRPGPRWNWSIRPDGKTVYTTAIGYPLFQAAVIKIGGVRAAVYANLGLWTAVFLMLFLLVWEGTGRSWAAAVAAGAALVALPWIEDTMQIMVEPWREPLFLFCLFAAGWLLLRFGRTGGLLAACVMALFLGLACSVKEANAIYLPAFGLLYLHSLFRKPIRERGWFVRLLLPVICGLIGLAPMFAHNLSSSGHPLISPQTVRATETVREQAAELGRNAGEKEGADAQEAPAEKEVAPKEEKGLILGVQYQMAHAYWWQYSRTTKRWFTWWWFSLAMAGLLWFLRGRFAWAELLAVAGLTGIYTVWGLIEYELWFKNAEVWFPGVHHKFQNAVTWGLSALAVGALAVFTRRRLGAFLLLLVLSHFALYFSWKNIDFRHMLLACVVYALCLGTGAYAVTTFLAERLRVPEAWRPVCVLAPLVAVMVFAFQWRPAPKGSQIFSVEDGVSFGADLDAKLEGESPILFGNRFMSEVADFYSNVPVLRLHELFNLTNGIDGVQALLGEFEDKGHTLYYLDSADLDPKNRERGIDFARVDLAMFRDVFDCVPVWSFPAAEYRLFFGGERANLSLYRLSPRTGLARQATLEVPRGGASFLQLIPRGHHEDMRAEIDGRTLDLRDPMRLFHPLPATPQGERLLIGLEGEGVPDPKVEARLLDWSEGIGVPSVSRELVEASGLYVTHTGYQELRNPTPYLLPVREVPDGFTLFKFSAVLVPTNPFRGQEINVKGAADSFVTLTTESGETWRRAGNESTFVFPLPEGGTTGQVARVDTFVLGHTDTTNYVLRVNGIRSELARQRLSVQTDERTTMAILYGRLAAAKPDAEKGPYAIRLGEALVREGTCYTNPGRSVNDIKQLLPVDEPGRRYELVVEGAGLIEPEVVLVRDRFEIPYGPRMELFPDAFHQPNHGAVWSKGRFAIPVPLIPGATRYTLTLDGADGEPDGRVRPLTLTLKGQTKILSMTTSRTKHHVTFEDVQVDKAEVAELTFEMETWSPKRRAERRGLEEAIADLKDDRELGFRLFRFIWEPAWR